MQCLKNPGRIKKIFIIIIIVISVSLVVDSEWKTIAHKNR